MRRSASLLLPWMLVVLMLPATVGPGSAAAESNEAASDSAQSARGSKWFPFPFIFYQPETRWGGGIGVLQTYRAGAGCRVSSNALLLLYTQEKQYSAAVKVERYSPENRWRLTTEMEWSRFPGTFYGIGNETREEDKESVTLDRRGVVLDLRRAVAPKVYVGGAAGFQGCTPREIEPGGLIATLNLPGREKGDLAFLGPVFMIDTRDRSYSPSRGGSLGVSLRCYDAALGSDWTFARVDLDARRYRALPGAMVLAVQVLSSISSNDPRPFYDLATLGGANVLRGIYEGRYRGRNRIVAQGELRIPILRRLDGAAFLSTGEVAAQPTDFRFDGLHTGGGVGLLFLLSEDDGIRLRVDVGFARGESGVYFAFGEAF